MHRERRKRREVHQMDSFDGYAMSAKAFRLAYLCFLLLWFLIAVLLIRLVISGVTKSNTVTAQDESTLYSATRVLPTQPPGLPDMAKMAKWGHDGKGVKINAGSLHPVHQEEYEEGLRKNAFNQYVSDRISMRRPLADIRHLECLQLGAEPNPLPNASVIIVFRDEPWTTLLRTVYSVVDRSPAEYIKEIILVDDGSTLDVLQYPRLEHYLSVLKKVRILRLPSRQGVAKARTLGAKEASGDVVIFLQPHCECTVGWLMPLLERLASNSSEIVLPVVDTIHFDTFEYIPQTLSTMSVGSFTWELVTKRRYLTKPVSSDEYSVQSPVITAGIFAVYRKYFFHLGGFDESLTSEESVNIEFSFRAWMCGGGIAVVLCSHVGYVFPLTNSRLEHPIDEDTMNDRLRIAEVWLNGYEDFVHERLPTTIPVQSSQTHNDDQTLPNLRENLACHSFSWFLRNVEPTKIIKGNILKRGTINHIVANETVLALAAGEDNIIILQEWYIRPFSVWYLMESGELQNEDNMCVILVEAPSEEGHLESIRTQAEDSSSLQAPLSIQRDSNDTQIQADLPFHDLQLENVLSQGTDPNQEHLPLDQNEIQPKLSPWTHQDTFRKTLEETEPVLKQFESNNGQSLASIMLENLHPKRPERQEFQHHVEGEDSNEYQIPVTKYVPQVPQLIQVDAGESQENEHFQDLIKIDQQQGDSGDLLPDPTPIQIPNPDTLQLHQEPNKYEIDADEIQSRRRLKAFQNEPSNSEQLDSDLHEISQLSDGQSQRGQDQSKAGADDILVYISSLENDNLRKSGNNEEEEAKQNMLEPNLRQLPRPNHIPLQQGVNQFQIDANEFPPEMDSPESEKVQNPKLSKSLLEMLSHRDHLMGALPLPPPRYNITSSSSANQTDRSLPRKRAVLKPCDQVDKGDQWILTGSGTLRHVGSGLCMEAQKTTLGTFAFRMVKCDDTSQGQKWSFSRRHTAR